ncbi:MAG: DUF2889 domain-containing protein [Deltaproteobacteria bacterium]|nr:DUF2889 domain-containing protein [Deltaproteobacteria bacterium]
MISIDKSKQKKIHTRRIDMATYEKDDRSIVVEGVLHDERLVEVYRPTGEKTGAGPIHHMVIRMQVGRANLVIEAIDVEIGTAPHEACREALDSLKPVIGMPIAAGFTARIKEIVGGANGCAHLVALLNAMAPAALQGAWNALARTPMNPGHLAAAVERIKDTCMLWREDGVLMKEYQEKLFPSEP